MSGSDDDERRRAPRFQFAAPVSVGTRSEHVVLGGRAVNASAVGVLVSFPGPALPINAGDLCLLSLHLTDGSLHVVGRVRRKELGDDELYYVGIEYEELQEHELSRIRQQAGPDPPSSPASGDGYVQKRPR